MIADLNEEKAYDVMMSAGRVDAYVQQGWNRIQGEERDALIEHALTTTLGGLFKSLERAYAARQ